MYFRDVLESFSTSRKYIMHQVKGKEVSEDILKIIFGMVPKLRHDQQQTSYSKAKLHFIIEAYCHSSSTLLNIAYIAIRYQHRVR